MTFTSPDFSDVLANEQTMNSRLTTCRNNLRTILTAEEIGYTEGDGIIPLIRKLPVPVLDKINVEMPARFSTGNDLTVNIETRDTNDQLMAGVTVDLYRVYLTSSYSTRSVHLGQITTNSQGVASANVYMPEEKQWFYIQARSGNVIGGCYGGHCNTLINPSDISLATLTSSLFSQHGEGSSSLLEIVEIDDNEGFVDITLEKQDASEFSSSFAGIKFDSLGTFTKSTSNKMFTILNDISNSTNTYWMGFGLAFTPDSWSTPKLVAAAKYMYGDGSGTYGFRQDCEGIQYMGSADNGTPQAAGTQRLYYAGGNSFTAWVCDPYAGDPTAEYPSEFSRHGSYSWNLAYLGPSGNAYASIMFNFPDSTTQRTFRFYGAGVI